MRNHYSQKKDTEQNSSRSIQNTPVESVQKTAFSDNRPDSSQARLVQLFKNSKVAQLATKITYNSPIDFKMGNATNKVGSEMHAELDPSDPIKGSNTASSDQDGIMSEIKRLKNISFVKGHLLNHVLGGRATVWNLFPITSNANSEHYHEVEKPIKHWIGNGYKVNYKVKAQADAAQNANDANGTFYCEADLIQKPNDNTSGKIKKTIASKTTKQNYEREYKKKNNQQISNRYAQVDYDQANTVRRDEYGMIKKNKYWNHMPGTSKLNKPDHLDQSQAMVHTSTGMVNFNQKNLLPQSNQNVVPGLFDHAYGDDVREEELDNEAEQEAHNEGALTNIRLPKIRRSKKSKKKNPGLDLSVRVRVKYERHNVYEKMMCHAVEQHLQSLGLMPKGKKIQVRRKIGKKNAKARYEAYFVKKYKHKKRESNDSL